MLSRLGGYGVRGLQPGHSALQYRLLVSNADRYSSSGPPAFDQEYWRME